MKEFLAKNEAHRPPYEVFNANRDLHAEVSGRMDAIEIALKKNPNHQVIYPSDFLSVPIDFLKRVHSPEYIDYLFATQSGEADTGANEGYRYPSVMPARRSDRSTQQTNGRLGYFSMDLYTPIHKDLWQAALTAASGAYSAALAILDGDQTSYAIGRPPGHHAGYDYMAGYCYLNNAAIAATVLSERGKVGILDIDFHHGNGTEDIFRISQEEKDDPQVLHVSIHADPDRMFPYFSGETTGSSDPLWKGINYALEAGVSDQRYDKILNEALARLKGFAPKYLVVPVGFDTHEKDPIGDFKLTTDYYERLSREIAQQGLPTVFVQEGGYNLGTIASNITAFIKGIDGAKSD